MGNVGPNPSGLQIEALLSVSPSKFTEPRMVRRVSSSSSATELDPLRGCLNLLLYYNQACEDDSGWLHAGWIKESLGRALLDQPLFCGRLRLLQSTTTPTDHHDYEKRLEIVSNDGGIRLIEARMPLTLSQFLDSKTKEEAETELVFWKDIDREYANFCPLFYLQVTNFECGGYSFGISCSLLLADLLFKENFLKRWAEIHNNMICSSNDVASDKSPIFYLPAFKRDGSGSSSVPNVFSTNSPSKKSGQTMIFNVKNSDSEPPDNYYYSSLALLCVEKAESKNCETNNNNNNNQMDLDYFSLFVTEPENNIKVEKCSKFGIVKPKPLSLESKNKITCSSWDEIEAHKVEFRQGNPPRHVSNWIGSVSGQIVIAAPFSENGISETKIIVTIPYY
ncbi:uncharacterized protein LOC133778082 [Humulus lupulus]|uniref:uncharacterized protein LOC133778082 n=1 Tax=Humulus lupulus TaxID=3486 RepID=UPI002B414EB3|nr:uncharacterized protein LOC133778082 [Humulus lupulus]